MDKRKGRKMEGLGMHHSTTEDKRVTGHSLVESLYVLLGRRCPLAPQLYRQQAVCAAEGVPFQSKIELMETLIRTFEPIAGTVTHVLLDSWYSAKRLWRAAREREFLITTGIKCNRWLRGSRPDGEQGWSWQRSSDYTAQLSERLRRVAWPQGKGGLCACRNDTGAQALSLPSRDRAAVVGRPPVAGALLGFQ